jgi:hypothetical protein
VTAGTDAPSVELQDKTQGADGASVAHALTVLGLAAFSDPDRLAARHVGLSDGDVLEVVLAHGLYADQIVTAGNEMGG